MARPPSLWNVLTLLALAVLVSGCDAAAGWMNDVGRDEGEPPPLQTSESVYTVRVTPEFLELDIVFSYRNPALQTVYLVGCNRRPQPTLQKRIRGRWIAAWSPSQELCLTLPPDSVTAGGLIHDTLLVRAARDEHHSPGFMVDPIAGEYRLVWEVMSEWTGGIDAENELPLEQRVSNSFRIEE